MIDLLLRVLLLVRDGSRDPFKRRAGARVYLADQLLGVGVEDAQVGLVVRDDCRPEVTNSLSLTRHLGDGVANTREGTPYLVDTLPRTVVLYAVGHAPESGVSLRSYAGVSDLSRMRAPSSARDWMPSFR
jgi:hypothetical protein